MARRATKVKNESPTNKIAKRKSRMSRSNGSFAGMIAAERQRLQKVRQNILSRRADIERELGDIERELKAMDVFLSAKQGRPARGRLGKTRAKRGAVRQTILDLIKSVPGGLTRGEIIEKLNAAEKAAQQSISNALSNMFKAKTLTRKDRKYFPA